MSLRLGSLLIFGLSAAPLPVLAQDIAQPPQRESAERPVVFAAAADPRSSLVVLMGSGVLAAGLPVSEDERRAIEAAVASAGFTGAANEVLSLRGVGARGRILLAGTGENPGASAIMEAAGKAAQEVRSEKSPIALIGAGGAQAMADAALGYALGQYRFDRYRSQTAKPLPADPVQVVGSEAAGAEAAWRGRNAGLAEGVRFARDMANEPANVIYPESFVARARQAFSGIGGVTIEVLDDAQMRRLGMGSITGVGQGSPRGSRLMLVSYKGAEGAPLALVGKGITFDSGGISIKPEDGMWRMKGDLSGAAAVTGTVLALARSRAPVHVVAVAALAENMPSGSATRPGDVVRTMSGRTIEVLNTDAEGRLVLVDAIEYVAARRNPGAIVDIATLTGAAARALGDEYAALFARHEELASALAAAGEASGERVWRLPLHKNYADDMKSDIADIKNVDENGSPGAGLGAHFVGFFADPAIPWAHIDMAGTMYAGNAQPLTPKGMTGYGVRLLEAFARGWRPSR